MNNHNFNPKELLTKKSLITLKGGTVNLPDPVPDFVSDLVNGDETDKRVKRPGSSS